MIAEAHILGAAEAAVFRTQDEWRAVRLDHHGGGLIDCTREIGLLMESELERRSLPRPLQGLDELAEHLREWSRKHLVLSMLIAGMDQALSKDTRRYCINSADRLNHSSVIRFTRARLLGCPLAEGADIGTAIALAQECRSEWIGSIYSDLETVKTMIGPKRKILDEILLGEFARKCDPESARRAIVDAGIIADMLVGVVRGRYNPFLIRAEFNRTIDPAVLGEIPTLPLIVERFLGTALHETSSFVQSKVAQPIGDQQFGMLQRNIDAIIEKIAALRLNLEIEYNFEELAAFMGSAGAFLNTTFNPRYCSQGRNSFWFRVVDQRGVTIGCHATKIFLVDDFFDLMETRRLWYDDDAARERHGNGQFNVVLHRPSILISGRVSNSGALWIHPDYRKQGLSLYLPYLSRSLCLRNHQIDYHTAIVLKSMAQSSIPVNAYGFTHVEPCLTGYFPVTGRHEAVYLCYMSQNEAIEQIYKLAWHPREPIELPRDDLDMLTG